MSDLSPDSLPRMPVGAALAEALPTELDAHPAATSLADGSASLAPLAQGAVFDSPQAGGVGGGPSPDLAPDAVFTRERQAVFLEALAASGAVRSAAARAGVSHQTAYRARLSSPVALRPAHLPSSQSALLAL